GSSAPAWYLGVLQPGRVTADGPAGEQPARARMQARRVACHRLACVAAYLRHEACGARAAVADGAEVPRSRIDQDDDALPALCSAGSRRGPGGSRRCIDTEHTRNIGVWRKRYCWKFK